MNLGYHTTSTTSCHSSFSVSRSSLFWLTNANVALVTEAPAIFGAGTSNMLLGENATILAGGKAARWIIASADCPPLPATIEPLHREVWTRTLVFLSSDAVVSDSLVSVVFAVKYLSAVKPIRGPMLFSDVNDKWIVSAEAQV